MVGSRVGRVLSVALVVGMLASITVPVGAVAQAGDSGPRPAAGEPRFAQLASGSPNAHVAKQRPSKALNVRVRPGVPDEQLAAAGSRLGFTVTRRAETLGWVQLEPNARVTPGSLATRLRESGLVRDVKPATVYQPAAITATDPLFAGQWSLDNTGQSGGTPDADIDATDAWETSRGDQDIIVAVVDTGINWSHADLKSNIWRNADEIPGNEVDDDGNGYVDDARGYDFYNYDDTVYDAADGDQHGTHVAGIIAAEADNGVGIAGVTDATIMPLKFLGPWGGDDFGGAEAIVYAVDNGARVINCSWGGEGESEILDEAIAYAEQAGVLIVCAAGNDGMDADEFRFYPAASSSPNVISVAATDRNDQLVDFSNYGDETVDIAAPGADVESTLPWETNGVYINRPPYRICYQPMQLEVLEPADQRDRLIVGSVEQVGATASTPVLVVDDSSAARTSETPGERLSVYVDALGEAGYANVTTWTTETDGAPTYAAMRGKVVVWFTGRDGAGWYENLVISDAEQAALSQYLDNGGRLVMASGELATDMVAFTWDPEWFYTYFGVELFDFITWSPTVRGYASGRFAGVSATVPSEYLTDEYLWPTGSDAIVLLDPYDPTVMPLTQVGGYGPLSGTSMAAPHVTGAAALLAAALPDADVDEIVSRLCNGSDGLEVLDGKTVYAGRLNVASALGDYAGRPKLLAPTEGAKLQAGTTATVSWAPAEGGSPTGYEVEFGTPVLDWSRDFNDGLLGEFEKADYANTGFSVTDRALWVHEGAYGAVSQDPGSATDLGDGWFQGAQSAVAATVTVPPGGGLVSLWWHFKTPSWSNMASIRVDQRDVAFLWGEPTDGFERVDFEVPAGEHQIVVEYINFEIRDGIPDEGVAIDDVRLVSHTFSPLATVPAGTTSATFTVPALDTDDAWLRVRATGAENDSAWTYVRNLHISSDALAPAAPTDLTVASAGNGWADASWSNPVDADYASTRVVWRTDRVPTGPNDEQATVAAEGTMTSASIGPVPHGETVYVAAYAMDAAGNWSAPATGMVDVADTTPPPAVELLAAEMSWGAPLLTWMPPDARDYTAVTVLRRTDRVPVVGDPTAEVVFEGTGPVASDWMLSPNATKAYYTVYTTDASGNRSAPRSVGLTIDWTAPEGAMELAGGADYTDEATVEVLSGVVGATEMRFILDDTEAEEVPWVPYADSASLTFELEDGRHTVRAQYRDAAGNVLELEDSVTIDLTAPGAPGGPDLENWNAGVRVAMPLTSDPSVVGYELYRAETPMGPWERLGNAEEPLLASPMGVVFDGGLTPRQTYYYALRAVDALGRRSDIGEVSVIEAAYGVVRVAGTTRYSTAAEIVERHFTRAETVILVSGNAWADALGAASLAGRFGGPVLLTGSAELDPDAYGEIERLGATSVIIVGGERSVAPKVAEQLVAHGLSVERIAGADRYETAALVAEEVVGGKGPRDGRVICVSGTAPADALAVGPYAYATRTPVILMRPDGVPAASARFIDGLRTEVDWLVVGGPASVPDTVISTFASSWRRIGGRDRYAVARSFADYAVASGVLSWNLVGLCNGEKTADALAAGPALGRKRGVLLLTTGSYLHVVPSVLLSERSGEIESVEIYGGTSSVTTGAYKDAHAALSIGVAPVDLD